MEIENLDEILEKSKNISNVAKFIFGKDNYTNREKSKKILKQYDIDWVEWSNSKKRKPNICLNCGKEIIGKDNRQKFCSRSCNATYNNYKRKGTFYKHRENYVPRNNYICWYCGGPTKGSRFCSNTCYAKYEGDKIIQKWKRGEISGSTKAGIISAIRNYIFEKNNFQCQRCGYNTPNPFTGNSILQIHHVDGDSTNSKEDNLELLCPNCHALTENYGSRNKKSTRIDKRLKRFQEKEIWRQ